MSTSPIESASVRCGPSCRTAPLDSEDAHAPVDGAGCDVGEPIRRKYAGIFRRVQPSGLSRRRPSGSVVTRPRRWHDHHRIAHRPCRRAKDLHILLQAPILGI